MVSASRWSSYSDEPHVLLLCLRRNCRHSKLVVRGWVPKLTETWKGKRGEGHKVRNDVADEKDLIWFDS